ncbi:MAG: cyclic nucleotide-binding domain-containing protein [Rhodospirillales bacterium]|nr:cyclic nucleotide-binding domain-containing protein [Rhodospirillales bacterium]
MLAFSSIYLTFEAGEELFQEGDPADGAYIIDEGEVEVLAARGGRQISVGTLARHDLFGEMAIILNQSRTATIRAKTELKVLKIDASVFLQLVTENRDAALAVMRSLSDKINRVTERYQQLEGRVHAEHVLSVPDTASD